MKFLLAAAVVVTLLCPSAGAGDRSQPGSSGRRTPGFTRQRPVSPVRAREAYRRLPLSFEQNRGQTDPAVSFLARGSGYTVFLTSNEAVLTLQRRGPAASPKPDGISVTSRASHRPDLAERAVVRMKLSGANHDVLVGGLVWMRGWRG